MSLCRLARLVRFGRNELVARCQRLGSTAIVASVDNPNAHSQTIELGGPDASAPLEVVRLAESITGRAIAVEHVPVEALEQQAREAAGTDAAIFPSLMLCQPRGGEIEPAPEWLRPQTTVPEYLRSALG